MNFYLKMKKKILNILPGEQDFQKKDNLYKRLSADIDYEKVFDVIDTERKHTMKYLSTNLGL